MINTALCSLIAISEPTCTYIAQSIKENSAINRQKAAVEKLWHDFLKALSSYFHEAKNYLFPEKNIKARLFPKLPGELVAGKILKFLPLKQQVPSLQFLSFEEKVFYFKTQQEHVSKLLNYYKADFDAIPSSLMQTLESAGPLIKKISLKGLTLPATTVKKLVSLFPHIEQLSLEKCMLSDQGFTCLKNLKLKTLTLRDSQGISELGISHLKNMSTLEELELPQLFSLTKPSHFLAGDLFKADNTLEVVLKVVFYISNYIFKTAFSEKNKHSAPIVLQKKAIKRRACIILSTLTSLKNLKTLVLPESALKLEKKQIQEFAKLKTIQKLAIECYSWEVDQDIFSTLALCPNLQECEITSKHITGEKAHLLEPLQSLSALTLSSAEITRQGFQSITKLTQLKKLNLKKSNIIDDITKEMILKLGQMKQLQELSLNISQPEILISTIGQFKNLHTLSLRPALDIVDGDIKTLCSLPKIHTLIIEKNCGLLTKHALDSIENTKTLRHVHLEGSLFSEDMKQKFHKKRPDIYLTP